jgi:hypothetical protein
MNQATVAGLGEGRSRTLGFVLGTVTAPPGRCPLDQVLHLSLEDGLSPVGVAATATPS